MLNPYFDTHRIFISSTRPLFEESVNALNAGAMRAAVLSLWVAAFFDILERIRFMSGSHKAAQKYIKNYDQAAASGNWVEMQKIENGILQKALDLKIINPDEEISLKRLYEDRNRCAHPHPRESLNAQFTPLRPDVFAHLHFTYSELFTRHPLEKSEKITKIISNEICSLALPQQKMSKTISRPDSLIV
ncbi:hypothetical protein [Arcanobacterium phocae]|uniref:hypothetical protein n=1 Tax=Arcanobacterium phocae TaxID=131112 RepID=UPI001C0E969B|nr:hypothetical protein [Arcanobacterium phocae]